MLLSFALRKLKAVLHTIIQQLQILSPLSNTASYQMIASARPFSTRKEYLVATGMDSRSFQKEESYLIVRLSIRYIVRYKDGVEAVTVVLLNTRGRQHFLVVKP